MKFLVRGLSDEELASVYGGAANPLLTCSGFTCMNKGRCYAYCPEVLCGLLSCDHYKSED